MGAGSGGLMGAGGGAALGGAAPAGAGVGASAGAASGFSANDLTEDQYVRVWEEYCKTAGQPFDPAQLRAMYRQHKRATGGQ